MENPTDGLTSSVETLTTRIEGLRQEVAAEREARDQEITAHVKEIKAHDRRTKRLTAAVIISILVALGSLFAAFKADNTANDIIATRTQSRISVCLSFNDFAGKHNKLVDENIKERQNIIDATNANPSITQEQKDEANVFFQERIAEYQQQKVDIRDCSADAVNKFYDNT